MQSLLAKRLFQAAAASGNGLPCISWWQIAGRIGSSQAGAARHQVAGFGLVVTSQDAGSLPVASGSTHRLALAGAGRVRISGRIRR